MGNSWTRANAHHLSCVPAIAKSSKLQRIAISGGGDYCKYDTRLGVCRTPPHPFKVPDKLQQPDSHQCTEGFVCVHDCNKFETEGDCNNEVKNGYKCNWEQDTPSSKACQLRTAPDQHTQGGSSRRTRRRGRGRRGRRSAGRGARVTRRRRRSAGRR
jgi:hypothetical protein